MKKNLKEKLLSRKLNKPNSFLMAVVNLILGFLNRKYKVKFNYDYDPKILKGKPTILVASHSSRLEFIYMMRGFSRKDINMVCGYQNIFQKGLYSLFLSLGVISKYLYQPDFLCVKQMLSVLKRNGAIGLFPEGIQSTSGSTHPINPATAQFIKHSNANVVIARSKGAYLATNRYSGERKKGSICVDYSLAFTPEMLKNLSEKQIYDILLEKIRYNDFEYNKIARNKYVGKKPNAFNIDKILYICPDCKEEHSIFVDNDTIKCKKCGFAVKIDEYYDIIPIKGKVIPADIDKWYKWQRSIVANQVKNDNFELKLDGLLCTIRLDKLRKPPKNRKVLSVGQAVLTNKGLTFNGTYNGEVVNFEFDANSLYSLTFSTKGFLEFYYKNEYFMLVPENYQNCLIKWTLASEEIHNLYDEKWKLACQDVYDYDEGGLNG